MYLDPSCPSFDDLPSYRSKVPTVPTVPTFKSSGSKKTKKIEFVPIDPDVFFVFDRTRIFMQVSAIAFIAVNKQYLRKCIGRKKDRRFLSMHYFVTGAQNIV